jgi:hypothetical protein
MAYTLRGQQPPRMVFVHIPKTAGISTINYIARRTGWQKTGRSRFVSEMPWQPEIGGDALAAAQRAIFVYGHFSWSTVQSLRNGRPNFVFTFLREPRARLWSLYRHMSTYLDRLPLQPHQPLWRVAALCKHMSPTDFFQVGDRDVQSILDNQMVRQLAGDMRRYPIADADWPALLEAAKRNVDAMDFVGFQETFDDDFMTLLRLLHIARPRSVPHRNRTRESHDEDRGAAVDRLLERFIRWDQVLYQHALQRRTSDRRAT